jgi:hypothetical protein
MAACLVIFKMFLENVRLTQNAYLGAIKLYKHAMAEAK